MERKTPLYDVHVSLGGKMVPFGGYSLPVQYTAGIKKEHMAVREHCGIFDVSHMGEVTVEGNDAVKWLNHLLTNRYETLKPGRARYSPMCYENGGTVDDLIVYRKNETEFFIIVNADNREKDFEWMKQNLLGDVKIEDISDDCALIAVQGPDAEKVIRKSVKDEDVPPKNYSVVFDAHFDDIPCMISRTGYTGEDGFEICCPAEKAETVFRKLLENGEEFGILPCGLGARDTLRLEAAMPLYGHEMNENVSPLEAGLGFAVKMDKDEFIGKEALEKDQPLKRKRIGVKATGRGIFREDCPVLLAGTEEEIGHTTSGTYLPYLKGSYAMALVKAEDTEPGTPVEVDVRGRKIAGEIVSLPFYSRKKKAK